MATRLINLLIRGLFFFVTILIIVPLTYWGWHYYSNNLSVNKSKFWSYQPICYRYQSKLSLTLENGKFIPQSFKNNLITNDNSYSSKVSESKNTFDFINKYFYKPEIKPYSYFELDKEHRIFWLLENNNRIVGAISAHYMNWIIDDKLMHGHYIDHLTLNPESRTKHLAPALIETALDKLNTECITPFYNGTDSRWPIVIFKIDNNPLPHGQKPLAELWYYIAKITLENDSGDGENYDDENSIEMKSSIDWEKWWNSFQNQQTQFAVQARFESIDMFKKYLSQYQLWVSSNKNILLFFDHSKKIDDCNSDGTSPLIEIYGVITTDGINSTELKTQINIFVTYVRNIMSKNGSKVEYGYITACNNGSNNVWLGLTGLKLFWKAHPSYLYVYNLNLKNKYDSKDIGLILS